jgi:hypothetical protein
MRITGTQHHGGIEPDGDDHHVAHKPADAPASGHGAAKTQTSQSDPSGLGWRAKLSGQHAAVPASSKHGGGAVTEAQVQKAYDDGAFSTAVDRKDLPKAAQKQFDADSKQSKADGYDTAAYKATVNGQTVFQVGKDDSDTGDYHANFFDASGKLVASGGGTERDGEYWNKI